MAVYLVGEPGVPALYHVAEEHKCARAVAQILLLNTVALVVLEWRHRIRIVTHKSASVREIITLIFKTFYEEI